MDSYNKLRVIGKGSYGEVWLVKHRRDKKQYVLKKLDVHNASKRERHAAEQEAKLLSKLKHPNIVSYKDSFETDEGHLYIAMGYCEGGDLYARLKEQKSVPLDEKQIVEWFVQIAMALQYMHERNILHRDLKTQNIFLTKSKIIKVGDLGIARVLDCSSDMATTLIGTPYYMSPELFSNKPYNHKSDVWALGCCVYEMTTLKHAFNAKDMNSLVYKILRGKMPNMPKQYSPELVNLIKAMLNHNPDRRPTVNRILRDSYIKKNIALFLESSRKEKDKDRRPTRSSASDSSEPESRRRDGRDVPDGAGDRIRPRKPRSVPPAITVKDEDEEPLQIGPELTPIREEELDAAGDSQQSRQQERRSPSSPSSRNGRPSSSSNGRAFKPQQSAESVEVSMDTGTSTLIASSNSQDSRCEQSPSNKNSLKHREPSPTSSKSNKKSQRSSSNRASSDRLEVASDDRPSSGSSDKASSSERASSSDKVSSRKSGPRPSSREWDKDKEKDREKSAGSKSSAKVSRSPEARRSERKSAVDRASPVLRARPLPSRDPASVTPRESSDEPKSSKSSRAPGRNVGNAESGYGSGSSSAYGDDSSRKRRDSFETDKSTPNLSARERRRERKDRETPRDPVSARSVDLNRRSLEQESRLRARPSSSRSEEFSDGRSNSRPKSAEYRSPNSSPLARDKPRPSKSTSSVPSLGKKQMRQPSIDNDDSSSSSSNEELTEITESKENKRNSRPPPSKPSLILNSDAIIAKRNETNSLNHSGREPLRARHPQRNPSTLEFDPDTEGEETGKEKEMNNFISALNTTLQLEKNPRSPNVGHCIVDDSEGEEEDDEIFVDDVELAPPGGTMFVRRAPRPTSASKPPGAGDRRGCYGEAGVVMPILEVESVAGNPHQFNVNISSPGKVERTLTTTGRLWSRITDLRKDCIRGLGVEKIKRAYDILDNYDAEELEPQLVHLLGKRDFDVYAGKIWQLKFCEEAAFGLL